MGWHFESVSSFGSDFNYDFHVSFTKEQIDQRRIDHNSGTITTGGRYINEELPGLSVIMKDEDGELLPTYSTNAAGSTCRSARVTTSTSHRKAAMSPGIPASSTTLRLFQLHRERAAR